jgi:hypothetical protein
MAKKDKGVLQDHPEVKDNAADMFFYEKQPVIEEAVNRGDSRQPGVNPYDITDDDLEALAKFAVKQIDKNLLMSSEQEAINDAVSMAIGSMDDGRWQGRVSSKTSDLIVGLVDKKLTASVAEKAVGTLGQNNDCTNDNGQKEKEAESMERHAGEKAEKPQKKEPKKAPMKIDPSTGQAKKVTPGNVVKEISGKKPAERATLRKMIQKGESTVILSSLVARLDKVAASIEKAGQAKLAEQLDMVSNTLEANLGKESFLVDTDSLNSVERSDSFLAGKFPWVIEVLKQSKVPGWEPQPFMARLQKEFIENPEVKEMYKGMGPESKQDFDRLLRLVNTILDNNKYITEVLGLVEKYQDADPSAFKA